MNEHEIQIISDGDGVAFIGDSALIEEFLAQEGIAEQTISLDVGKVGSIASKLSPGLHMAGNIAENNGKWLKLTDESAAALRRFGPSIGRDSKLVQGVVRADKGKIAKHLEFVPNASSMLSPAMLTGAAGIMAQVAMEQQMAEITDYLEKIDKKLDDVLQGQKDSILAGLDGVAGIINEAMMVRQNTGRVSDVTWSKVQGTAETIAATQATVLRKLNGITKKLESKKNVGDLLEVVESTRSDLSELLAVLAQTVQLQDALGVIELDRVIEDSPGDLDTHRIGLQIARDARVNAITEATNTLLDRIQQAASLSNGQVVRQFINAPKLFKESKQTANKIVRLQNTLGVEGETTDIESKAWKQALAEVRDDTAGKAVKVAVEGKELGERLVAEVEGHSKRRIDRLRKRSLNRSKDSLIIEHEPN